MLFSSYQTKHLNIVQVLKLLMKQEQTLKLCVCGHTDKSHNTKGLCLEIVPDNNLKKKYTEEFCLCGCKNYDTAIDLSLDNIHVKELGAAY